MINTGPKQATSSGKDYIESAAIDYTQEFKWNYVWLNRELVSFLEEIKELENETKHF